MKRLTKTQFFLCLKAYEEASCDLRREYDEFANRLFSEWSASNDWETYHNVLVYTYVELSCITAEAKKDVSEYVEKAIVLVDRQIEFVEKQIVSEQTGVHCPLTFKTAINQVLQWRGAHIELVELLNALHEAGSFGKRL